MPAKKAKIETRNHESGSLTLRVAEALPKDVGRGIARIDPDEIERLGLKIGDLVLVRGKRETGVKLLPTFSDYRGKGLIQIDGIVRENAKVGIDEKIRIHSATSSPARSITLKALSPLGVVNRSGETSYLGKLVEGLPVAQGDKIRVTLFGSRTRDFTAIQTTPAGGLVFVTPQTTVRVEGTETKEKGETRSSVAYEDVGGLDREMQRVREMIELPLKSPQIFERLGIDPPKGVLLYGPPGTGKTLIARAVAHESDANFFTVNGPEIVHKFYGESEAHLRSIFEEASRQSPSIIFIDEIDSVAPKRANVQGEVEKRIVATLLSLMDGLKSRGQLIVIGATNMPDLLDPALRRPGRFDREISIGIPDRNGRLRILEIHTRGMPLAEDVSLEKLSDITHGYVGADLEALAREAAMVCLRESMEKGDITLEEVPYEVIETLEVTHPQFMKAMNEVEPSAIREISIESPNVHWSDVGGLEDVKRTLRETVEWPLKFGKLFEKARLKPTKGILLGGSPGTGKTLIAKALATESEVNFISVKGPELVSKWIGESEKGIREVFKKAKAAAPCVLFFDEIDSMAPKRGGGEGDSGVMGRTISQFLTELDGLEELRGVVILGATNRVDLIDPALIRPGRFDHIIHLGLPDEEGREAIFRIHTGGRPLEKGINLRGLSRETEGKSGAEIESICRQAVTLAVRSFIERYGDEANEKSGSLVIRKEHFDEAVSMIGQKAKRES
ncbi:MAG: CDC48 family AAA ATPase [Deltaproteobacteria bacterium]|nr:CDC48 family AAA ATPase [Deltaproteobacteria bacterium]